MVFVKLRCFLTVSLKLGCNCFAQVNAAVVNSHLEGLGPFRVKSGKVARVHLSIPFRSLLAKSVIIEIHGLTVIVEPWDASGDPSAPRASPATSEGTPISEFQSPRETASATPDATAQESMDVLTAMVNRVLSQLMVRLVDVEVRLAGADPDSDAIVLSLPLVELSDQTPSAGYETTGSDVEVSQASMALPDVLHKCVSIPAISLSLASSRGSVSPVVTIESPSAPTQIKAIVNRMPHLVKSRPALDLSLFVHELSAQTSVDELQSLVGVLQLYSMDNGTKAATVSENPTEAPKEPSPPPVQLAASTVLDAVPLISVLDDEDELEMLAETHAASVGPVDSLATSSMFHSAVAFQPISTASKASLRGRGARSDTFSFRCDVVSARIGLKLEGGLMDSVLSIKLGSINVSAATGEATVISVTDVDVVEIMSDGSVADVVRVGQELSRTGWKHALRIDVPFSAPGVAIKPPVFVAVGPVSVMASQAFMHRLALGLRRQATYHPKPSQSPRWLVADDRVSGRHKAVSVLLACSSVQCSLGKLGIGLRDVKLEIGSLSSMAHTSALVACNFASLEVVLCREDVRLPLIHAVQHDSSGIRPGFAYCDTPSADVDVGFQLFPPVAHPSGQSQRNPVVFRAFEQSEAGAPSAHADINRSAHVEQWSDIVKNSTGVLGIRLGRVMIDMTSTEYAELLVGILELFPPPSSKQQPLRSAPKPLPSAALLPPFVLTVDATEAVVRLDRQAVQRDLTMLLHQFTLGMALYPDSVAMDIVVNAHSLAGVTSVATQDGRAAVVVCRQPSTPLQFQASPMLGVRVSTRHDAFFGKKTTVVVDASNAVFPCAITWDWIMDLLDLVVPDVPGEDASNVPHSAPPSYNPLTVVHVNIAGSSLVHRATRDSMKRHAFLLGLGSLQLTCNVMKKVKEQGLSITCRNVELHVSKQSRWQCGESEAVMLAFTNRLRSRREMPRFSALLAVHAASTSSCGFHQALCSVFASCPSDLETAGFLRVADLSDVELRVRLPANGAAEAIHVEVDGGKLTGLACLDTLVLTLAVFDDFGDSFSDVMTQTNAIEHGVVLPKKRKGGIVMVSETSRGLLSEVDDFAFGKHEAASASVDAPLDADRATWRVPVITVSDYFHAERATTAASEASTPVLHAWPELPVRASALSGDDDDFPPLLPAELVTPLGSDGEDLYGDDDDEFADAVGDFGGVVHLGDDSRPVSVDDVKDLLQPTSPPTRDVVLPLYNSDVGASEVQGVWYDGSGPGTGKYHVTRGLAVSGIAGDPHHFSSSGHIDPLAATLEFSADEFMTTRGGKVPEVWCGRLTLAFKLRRLDVSVTLFGGCDWSDPTAARTTVTRLFAGDDADARIVPGRHRKIAQAVEVNLLGVACAMKSFGCDFPQVPQSDLSTFPKWALDSVMVFAVQDFEVHDRIATSPIDLLLGLWSDDRMPRPTTSPMLRFRLDTVLPTTRGCLKHLLSDERRVLKELRVHLRVLPLRIIVSQAIVDMSIDLGAVVDALMPPSTTSTQREATSEVHIQVANVGRVRLKVDYEPGSVSADGLRHGEILELVKLIPISGMELDLSPVELWGCSGWGEFGGAVAAHWARHIKRNQLHKLAAGVNAGLLPLRTLANLGAGVADVIMLPLRGIRSSSSTSHGKSDVVVSKATSVARGFSTGVSSLMRALTLEALRVGVGLSNTAQSALEAVSDVVGPDDVGAASNGPASAAGSSASRRSSRQPLSAAEGLSAAYTSVKRGFEAAAATIVTVPIKEYHRVGAHGAVKAVVRAVPVAVLQPLIGTTEAVSKSLIGVRNSLDAVARSDDQRKYKSSA